jgi:hypothetical protein
MTFAMFACLANYQVKGPADKDFVDERKTYKMTASTEQSTSSTYTNRVFFRGHQQKAMIEERHAPRP